MKSKSLPLLLLHALLLPTAEPAVLTGAPPVIDWASQPVSANQTVLLLGGPFSASSEIALSAPSESNRTVTAAVRPQQPSAGSVKFSIPGGLPLAQWRVSVLGEGSACVGERVGRQRRDEAARVGVVEHRE